MQTPNLFSLDAVVLCGGLGTRLASVTGGGQKVMVDVGGRPFIHRVLEGLGDFGRRILCVGHGAAEVEAGVDGVEFSRESEQLGTGAALRNARELVWSEPFILANGDTLVSVDWGSLVRFHLSHGGVASPVLSWADCGWVGAGAYCFSRAIFSLLPEGRLSLEADVLPKILSHGVRGFMIPRFLDIGTPERLGLARRHHDARRL